MYINALHTSFNAIEYNYAFIQCELKYIAKQNELK